MSAAPSAAGSNAVRRDGGWLLHAILWLALAASAVYLQANWSSLPQRFPVHWGAGGQPNAWAAPVPAAAYGPLLIATGIVAILALLTAAARHRGRSGVAVLLATAECSIAATAIWIAFFPLIATRPWALSTSPPPLLGAVLIAADVLILLLAAIAASSRRASGGEI